MIAAGRIVDITQCFASRYLMHQAFSKLRLDNNKLPDGGIAVFSPLDGQVQLPEPHSFVAAFHGFLAETVQIQIHGPRLVAPFNGICQRVDQGGTLLSFRHQNGLRLDLCFQTTRHAATEGFRYLVAAQCQVKTGQAIAELDLAKLQRHSNNCCLISIQPSQAIKAIYYRSGHLSAGQDILFSLQLHQTNHSPNQT